MKKKLVALMMVGCMVGTLAGGSMSVCAAGSGKTDTVTVGIDRKSVV